MHSIRRGCQSALSNPKSINPITNGSRRAFSRSAACRRGALPQFLEPSSSELSNLLSTLNSKVLLPEHLTKDQRKLVYKQENRARLEAEPIEITLGEITLPLEHINRNRDQPSRWDTIRDVVEASKTPEDWENVVRMMEGFRDAGVRLKPRWFEKIVRKLNEAGMQHLVLKSLQRARETGLRLRDEGVVHQVFKGLHDKAAESEWDAAETKKALSFAEQIVELMEKEDHLGKSEPRPQDLRASPFVIAWPLELAAARAKLHTEGQDRDGKVMKYASRLMNAAHQDDFISSTLSNKLTLISATRTAPYKNNHERNIENANLKRRMLEILPLWNALRLSNNVLGEDMPMAVAAQELQNNIRKVLSLGQKKLESEVGDGFVKNAGFVVEEIKRCEQT